LNCYDEFAENRLSAENFVEVLKIIENFLIRRYIANVPTNQLDKIFPSLYKQVTANVETDFISSLKSVLSTKNYPTDIQFRKAIELSKLYGGGDKIKKTKHLLTLIEQSYGHKELIDFEPVTIEHILPQTISEAWKHEIGDKWEETHDLYLHTLGNLTLTAYNSELSNENFEEKKKILQESHLELNRYFNNKYHWCEEDIKQRAEHLSARCLQIWSYFGEEDIILSQDVTGKKPYSLTIWGEEYRVRHWVEVLEYTVKIIADLAPDKLDVLIKEYPRFINRKKDKFRRAAEVIDGIFVEKNYSAESIQRFCIQAIETIDLSSEDWHVESN
jgi:hypothetical protein